MLIIYKGGEMVLKNNTARIMVGIVVGILLFTVSSASAATITVDDSGGADYLTIQAAINNANASDVIEVQSGTYLENVVVNKTLSLKGIGMPLVNASGSGTAITITSSSSTVYGFNVTGSGTDWNGGDADSGIKIMSDDNTVLNCSAGFNNYGVYVFESKNNTIENNSVYSNIEGIYTFYSSNNSILKNDINLNTNRGVFVSNSNNCTISNNTVSETIDGIYLTTSTNCSILGNTADSNTRGIYLYSNSINNFLTDNIVTGNSYSGIYLSSSGSSTLTGNDASGDSEYGIRLISSSGSTLIGNNASGNSYSGIYLDSSDSSTLISNNASGNSGDGIGLMGSDSSTLTSNDASGNSGDGISLIGSDSSTLTDNNASGNSGDGIYLSSSYGILAGNDASGNSNYGIYLHGFDSNTLTGNNASGNSNYGIYLSGSDSNTLTKNNALNNVYGIYVDTSSSSNTFHKNNIIDNINYNAYDTVGLNSWSYNHYSDYTGSDSDGGGIGDTAYYISGDVGAKDMLPAMQPWNISEKTDLGANFTLYSGNNILLYEGYTLTLQQVDVGGNKAWITFEKDGIEVDSMVRNVGELFSYTTTIDGTNHLIFQGILDTVFQGQETSLIKITYFYQFSEINGSVLIENSNDLPNSTPSITLSSPSSSFSNTEGDSATFTITIDQVSNVTWILDGNTIQMNTSVTTASYYNNSAQLGTHNLTIVAENVNGTSQNKWIWTVVAPPAPSITLSSPSSVSDVESDSRTFTATIDQVANVTWIFDGVILYTNTSVTTASYYNTSAHEGVYNITIIAENTNGTDQNKWTWTVTTPNTYTMQLQKGWNLVSTPLTPDTPNVNTLFDSNSDVILPIYSWNTANKQYYDVSTIEISKGYWILALNDTQVTFTGTPYSG